MKKKSCLNQESPLSRGITHLVLVFASFLAFGPFVWMFLTSIKTYEETIQIPMKFLPEIPQWVNYAIVSNKLNFPQLYLNTILVTVLMIIGQILVVTICAYAFDRLNFPGKNVLFLCMLALMMVEAGLGVSGLAVLPAALAGALVALGLWAFPPARLGAGCCGSLLAAGAIGCIPLSLDMTSLTVPLALPFWAAGGLLAAQLLCAKRTGKPLRCWVKKHKMSPETVFLYSFALSAVGYVLALALLRWC